MAPADGRGNFALQRLEERLTHRLSRIVPAQRGGVQFAAARVPAQGQREVKISNEIQQNVADTLFAGHGQSPHIQPPTSTARAPSASAFKTSAPRRIPLSNNTGTRPFNSRTTSGSASSAPMQPSTCRPP